ncbi:MAG TPA: DUF3090 family protein [Acidimicrobiales bacterium]|nr:DUF3090 family protein [Acidimicrobiales bacterium]
MSEERDLPRPDRFTVGALGEPGDRVFLLQCQQGTERLTVKVEKQQVAVLASYLARIVRELGQPGSLPEDAFEEDAEAEWVVRTIGVSFDEDDNRVVIVLEEQAEEDEEESGQVARVSLSLEQAAAFAIRATALVEAGRPPCPLCGLPLDPSGHDCPRTNGHRPPAS